MAPCYWLWVVWPVLSRCAPPGALEFLLRVESLTEGHSARASVIGWYVVEPWEEEAELAESWEEGAELYSEWLAESDDCVEACDTTAI